MTRTTLPHQLHMAVMLNRMRTECKKGEGEMKKVKVWLSVLAVVFSVTVAIVTKPSSKGLELVECDLEPQVDTRIDFFVDSEVLESMGESEIDKRITGSIKYANAVLENSCIPMTRSKGKVRIIDLDKTKVNNLDRAIVAMKAELAQRDVDMAVPNLYFGLIFHHKYERDLGLGGQAKMLFDSRFFAISSNADKELLEHELGHLAWAQHTETYPTVNLTHYLNSMIPKEYHHKLKPYARGYKCGTAGTIMSYEAEILPIYSSPLVRYQEKVCGNAENGDNARMLREYAMDLAKHLGRD